MAQINLYPEKDSTIYSLYPALNSGMDEIIEASLLVGYEPTPLPQTSRILIKFSTEDINNIINTNISNSQWQVKLKLFTANVEAFNIDTILDIYPISGSWGMGTGKYMDDPETTNGVSWAYRDYSGSLTWTTSSFGAYVTASYSSSVSNGGGTWYTGSAAGSLHKSQSFSYYDDKDLNVDVKDIVNIWYSGTIENNGFIIKQRNEFVNNNNLQPKIKYFSRDTHTIYPPYLEFKWRDYIFSTGSSSSPIINTSKLSLNFENNPNTFFSGSINIFRIFCKPTYPTRTFQTSSIYTKNYYLPTSSYYSIKDMHTNETIIDFDSTYTQISADATSSYFKIYMDGLEPERYYKIQIKTIVENNTLILDNDYYFKRLN